MKKILFVAVLAFASMMVYAGPRAIGGRLGAFSGVSYEHAFGDSNMLEIEAGFSIDGRLDRWWNESSVSHHDHGWGRTIQAAVTYDWIDPFGAKFPWEHKGEWHWYLGVGGAGGFGWNFWNSYDSYRRNWGFAAAAGRAGVEYDFWFPLQLSIDFRPTLGVGIVDNVYNDSSKAGLYWEMTCLALGVRYKF